MVRFSASISRCRQLARGQTQPEAGALRGRTRLGIGSARIGGLILLVCLLSACSSLPRVADKQPSHALADGQGTELSALFADAAAGHPGKSGLAIIDTGSEALQLRLAMLTAAERTVDLQYYIWNSDVSGRLLARALLDAADRGVRIRLLVDDFNLADRDGPLVALQTHPAIEVRIYNPNASRSGWRRWLGLLGDFGRLNQRMHNKLLVVDTSAAITGGRNIGDEYFDLDDELNLRDRDLLAVGAVVRQLAGGFDEYWNSERSFPVAEIASQHPDAAESRLLAQRLRQRVRAEPVSDYSLPGQPDAALALLRDWRGRMVWAPATLLIDPVRGLDDSGADDAKPVARALAEAAARADAEVLIESAYLILGEDGQELVGQLVSRKVPVKALTNSLASNDLTTNHSGYARQRPRMLASGMELFEFRPDAASCRQLLTVPARCGEEARFGLHAKSMVIDRRWLFVGSFNLNLRSVYLNSEIGLLVDSPELSEQVAQAIERNMLPQNSWRVTLTGEGSLIWSGEEAGQPTVHHHEPQTGAWRRLLSNLLALLPIEKFL